MLKYFIHKIGYSILVLVLAVGTITTIIFLAPVDPARLTFGQRADNAMIEAKRKELGLDLPLSGQLLKYLRDISPINYISSDAGIVKRYAILGSLQIGDKLLLLKKPYLRESFQSGRPVSEILADAVPKTIILAFSAMAIAMFLGILLGIISAIKQHSAVDRIVTAVSVLGYSIPSYVMAVFLALIFGYLLKAQTGLNLQGSLFEMDDLGNPIVVWRNLLLPSIALGIRPVGVIAQITRSSMLDVLKMDFMRTAKSKGLSLRVQLVRHALKNALNPVLTAVSSWLAALLAGAFFVENVFSFKGLGEVTVTALLNFDLPVVIGAVLFIATFFVLINLISDFLYTMLDPRISFD
ncbi:MAG: ABC transporter permease [Saprospiraceae bacterium]